MTERVTRIVVIDGRKFVVHNSPAEINQQEILDQFFLELGLELWREAATSVAMATDKGLDDDPSSRALVIEGMLRAAQYDRADRPDMTAVKAYLDGT